eukprot:m.225881 g.225881  ORF g.225881 m.225881 type:complete len:647 (+) comp16820_c0_seq1:203-2143(+)
MLSSCFAPISLILCIALHVGTAGALPNPTAEIRARNFANQTLVVYDGSLENGFSDYSWAKVNLKNPTPTHTSPTSIRVDAYQWQALYLHHNAFNADPLDTLQFWVYSGTPGLQVQAQGTLLGKPQPAIPIINQPAVGTWFFVSVSLNALGVAANSNFDGFWLQVTNGGDATFYVDNIALVGQAPASSANITVDASHVIRHNLSKALFGINAAVWDGVFDTDTTVDLLHEAGYTTLRFPGGSISDTYNWKTGRSLNNTWAWTLTFDRFAARAIQGGFDIMLTTNYGSGTAEEAAEWAQYCLTKNYPCKYFEVGNECYGSWEHDEHAKVQDPVTYAAQFQLFYRAIKAVSPSFLVGAVTIPGEDTFANYASESVTNPRTHTAHAGWTPVVLSHLRDLAVMPDFIIDHRYPQNPGEESDPLLLHSTHGWTDDAVSLRQMLTDYMGPDSAKVALLATENNCVSSLPNKQSTSLVNAVYLADSFGQLLTTEFQALMWWDLRNGPETNPNQPGLYGWRTQGDYGIVSTGNSTKYPAFYAAKMVSKFARPGDDILLVDSTSTNIAAYASRRPGQQSVILINKSPSPVTATLSFPRGPFGPTPATLSSWGFDQDEAARMSQPAGQDVVVTQTTWTPGTVFAIKQYSLLVVVLSV